MLVVCVVVCGSWCVGVVCVCVCGSVCERYVVWRCGVASVARSSGKGEVVVLCAVCVVCAAQMCVFVWCMGRRDLQQTFLFVGWIRDWN